MNKATIALTFLVTLTTMAFSQIQSTLEVYHLESGEREVVLQDSMHFEAPNWSRDGKFLVFNSEGHLYRFDLTLKTYEKINTGFAILNNNDHGISPDGSMLVISNFDVPDGREEVNWLTSKIYTLPITGGTPELVTEKSPSFWHGWSPDGKKLAYVARRNGDFDIYEISIDGGEEVQLTSSKGLDDGPDYSHDGKYLYYNSMQSGKMEIWRMNEDGSNPIQLTDDKYSNWFPHPSPDGKYVVYIAYLEDQGDAHPPMKEVALQLMDLDTGAISTLCTFTGGQGSLNVPSWSPDGKKFAFVSYRIIEN